MNMPGKGKQQQFQQTQNYQHQQQQQQQQRQQHHTQQPQRVIIPGTDFHVPQQNYGGQPGGQVGGGGNSVGVPGGRGPPPLGSIQNIGQSATGIQQQGGQTGVQQPPPQSQTPGVQSQQPQGPPPTTTPPVHTPPQEMGKQAHLQAQSLQQGIYVANQTRPASQVYYQAGARQQAPRGVNHRGGQGGGGAQVVGMQGVGGGGGQQTAMYPHPGALPVPPGAVYMQGQVPLHPPHAGPHQQSVYTMNPSQTQPIQFSFPPQRHQGQHNQSFYPSFQPTIVAPNIYGFAPAPTTQHAGFYYAPQGQGINLSRAAAGAVTGGAQHVGSPLPGGQGAAVVQQGGIQQPPQQPQPLQAMTLPLGQTDVYQGHNGGGQNSANNSARNRKQRRTKAILDIVDPKTGKNISEEIYDDDAATQSGGSSNRATPQPQNCGMEMIADFAARVAKAATEESDSGSPAPSSAPDTPTPTPTPTSNHPPSQTITNIKQIQTSPDIDNSQCNINTGGGPPISATTQSIPPVVQIPVSHQSLVSSINTTQSVPIQANQCAQTVTGVKPKEHKPLQTNVKEFQPKNDVKIVSEETPQQIPVVINQKITSPQLANPAPVSSSPPVVKTEPETALVQITPGPTPTISQTSSIVTPVDQVQSGAVTTTNSNPVPSKEDFPSLEPKVPINSPARRKQGHQSVADMPFANAAKEPKERKLSEKNSRGTTPTPNINQADHHHPKPNGDTIDKHDQEPVSKNDQRSADGKANSKQKKRNQLKNRDLNRKGAEKEGTDMDAFVNVVPPAAKPETKQQTETATKQQDSKESSPHPNDTEKESAKDIKDEENIESKKEADAAAALAQKIEQAAPESSKENTPIQTPTTEKVQTVVQNNKESSKESSPTIEETPRIQEVCKMPVKTVANDVVDHVTAVVDDSEIESAIVAQKNEENSKVSALRATSEEEQESTEVIDKENDTEEKEGEDTPKGPPPLKYTYSTDQWSPLNVSGKKVYDREFLMQLQTDPSSKIKPTNLPDLEVVLKDNSRNRGAVDMRQFKDVGLDNRHASLFPGFVKSQSTRGLAPKRGSQQGKAKTSGGPKVIHVSLSLREDVKLRETENAWKPGRMKPSDADEEELKTEALYKKVRGVLNKLTPQKFATLVNQVRALQIDSQERLQGVINLVFEKAVDEPSFSVAYALMCKELAMMQVSGSDTKAGKEESGGNFRKLIITRCQMEFEKNTVDENARAIKMKEIEACPDPDKRKELLHILNEEERKIRVKSVGNIRFIGELFKQGMLTTNIMHRCIRHLLTQIDEESLECLCKLLSTIGKDLESKGQSLDGYFKQMLEIVNRKGPGKVSSRVRFMLQDVVELRLNKWVPRRDDSNPKTMDQIQKEAETERLDTHLNNTPMNTPRKDDRNSDRKRNRGGGPTEEGGWSAPVRSSRTQYSVETSKLKNKPPPMDNLQLGNKNMFQWSRNVSADAPKTLTPNKYAMLENMNSEQDKRSALPLSGSRSTGPRDYGRQDYKSSYDGRHSRNGSQQLNSRSSSRDSSLHDSSRSQSMSMPPPQIKSIPQTAPVSTPVKSAPRMTEEQLAKKAANILEEYLSDTNVKNAALEVRETFDDTTFANFVRETLNDVVEKSATARKQVSQLMTHLLSTNILPLPLYLAGLAEVLELAEDLVIDIPKIWVYLAELIWYPLAEGVHPFSELKTTMAPLKSKGLAGKLMGELMIVLIQEKTPKWIKDKWDESGLQWSDFMPESESKDFIKKYKLEFLFGDSNSSSGSLSAQLNMEQIHERLHSLISNEKEYSYDNVVSWISANVGDRANEPLFIRVLMTVILEVSIEPYNQTWKFKAEKFQNLQNLIYRYIDAKDLLELNCLIAIQEYIHKLEHPSGVLLQVIEKLSDGNIVSDEAFLAWESNKDPTAQTGKSVAMMALTSFFTSLKEAEDESTSDEA